jgi:DNA adenine methylase
MVNDGSLASRSSASFIKPPFGYFGAKQRLAKRIVTMLPPHNAWVEVFCGSAVVTLNKTEAPIEVINDLDGDVVNLFEVLRDQPMQLCEQVALTPYAREEFVQARNWDMVVDPLERARRFLVAAMMTINGTSGSVHNSGFSFSDSYARGGREARVNRWYRLPERLEQVIERLRSIRIENKDARKIVEQYAKRPATLMYLDPPYLMKREHVYALDANEADFHEELLIACVDSRAMLIVSGYKNKLYSKYLSKMNGWAECTILTTTRGTNGADGSRTEVLWVNEAFAKAKKSGLVPIRLSKTEARLNKLNPTRTAGVSKASKGLSRARKRL